MLWPQQLLPTSWAHLPPDLVLRIARAASPNDAAATLRLVDKPTRARLSDFTTIRLSQPVPCHAFRWRWAAPGAVSGLSLKQRSRLACLTAASGQLDNVQLLFASTNPEHPSCSLVGFAATPEVFEAAAAAGQIGVCRALSDLRCQPSPAAFAAAAHGGHLELCRWLHAQGWVPADRTALEAAARGGHTDVIEWLLSEVRPVSHLART
jgi:hypothetical protein